MNDSKNPQNTTAIAAKSWQLDHVAHAVPNLDEGLELYQKLWGFELEHRETLVDQLLEIAYLKLANSSLELLAPLPGNKVLKSFFDKRGAGLHHICFRVENLEQELERLKNLGVRLIDSKPRTGSRGKKVAFLHPESCAGTLIELCSRR